MKHETTSQRRRRFLKETTSYDREQRLTALKDKIRNKRLKLSDLDSARELHQEELAGGKVGSPPMPNLCHVMLAAHLLLRREKHGKVEPLKASYSEVAERWGVTRPFIEQRLKKHKAEAAVLAATLDESSFDPYIALFRAFGDPKAEANARAFRKQKR